MRMFSFVAILLLSLGCSKVDQKPVPPATLKGGLEILLTDAPLPYTAVYLNIIGLEYNSSPQFGITTGWDSLPLKAKGIINLLTLQNGDSAYLANTSLSTVSIRQLRMKFDAKGNSVVVNGVSHPLILAPEASANGVTIPVNYSVNSGQTRTIWIDINASSSIRYDSLARTYSLEPVIRTFEPSRSGRITGQVVPQDAQVVVTIVKDSSTFSTTCYPDYNRGGYFSAVGLDSGSYKVYFTPANPAYRSRTFMVPHIYNTNHTFSIGTINMGLLPYVPASDLRGNWFVRESVSTLYPDSFVGLDSFYAPTIVVNDSTFAIVQTGRLPDKDWVRSWPYVNADTLNFTPLLAGNALKNNYQGNIGTYAANKDTFNIRYAFGNGAVVYMVSQKWVRQR